ncbi:unnamed protein product [Phytomonas sp. EM1]|nr:unnamed protein product [Phytomonas sp. EM1]|eukprot:CCW61481.1 unnamed protein product [Phytomonas sp. isolate EM1]
MQSLISRCEEIQKKIQLIHDRGEREQKLFDTISAEHPELSGEEVVAYVQSKVKESEPKSINFNGHCLSVGDYVETINDPELLARAERGHFVQSATKEIYLGEKGKVTRIWSSFQGKPAVELLFADDAQKTFLLECIHFGDRQNVKETTSVKHTKKASLPKEKQSSAPLRVSSSPQWDEIIQLKSTVSNVPKAKPTEATLPSEQELPASPVNNTQYVERIGNSSTDKQASTVCPPAIEAIPQRQPITSLEPPAVTFHSIGLVKEAFSDQLGHIITSGKEELGKPLYIANSAKMINVSHEIDNLAKTPRPDFLNASPQVNRSFTPFYPAFVSRVPLRCPPGYRPKFSKDDPDTNIPWHKSSTHMGLKRCWVAGYDSDKSGDLRFCKMMIHTNMNSLEAILGAATKELGWKTTAKRLFSESGTEIMWADAILDNSRLVVTTGSNFHPALLNQMDSQVDARQTSDTKSKPHFSENKSDEVSQQYQSMSPKTNEERRCASLSRKSNTPRSKTSGVTIGNSSVSSPSTKASRIGPRKHIHIRVYENGNYESDEYERAYRTITIRPTYRTLHSVMALITRELEWKRGMKTEILFDASGAEITSMDQLRDGASVIASAGDRFIVPYPNSSLHKEAIEFSRKTINR